MWLLRLVAWTILFSAYDTVDIVAASSTHNILRGRKLSDHHHHEHHKVKPHGMKKMSSSSKASSRSTGDHADLSQDGGKGMTMHSMLHAHKTSEMKKKKMHEKKYKKDSHYSKMEIHKKQMKSGNTIDSLDTLTSTSEQSAKGMIMSMMTMMAMKKDSKSTNIKAAKSRSKMQKMRMGMIKSSKQGGSQKTRYPTLSPSSLDTTMEPTPSTPGPAPSLPPVINTPNPTTTTPTTRITESPTPLPVPDCDCDLCTPDVLQAESDGFTCQERILFAISQNGLTEIEACAFVATEFVDPCGPCHPTCVAATLSPTLVPTAPPTTARPTPTPTALPTALTQSLAPSQANDDGGEDPQTCGCPECNEVLDDIADGVSCGTRIDFAQTPEGGNFPESEACALVGSTFPAVCGACDPTTCNNSPSVCGCPTCTPEVLETDAEGVTCEVRINFLQTPEGGNLSELQACGIVAADHPDSCGPCSPCP